MGRSIEEEYLFKLWSPDDRESAVWSSPGDRPIAITKVSGDGHGAVHAERPTARETSPLNLNACILICFVRVSCISMT